MPDMPSGCMTSATAPSQALAARRYPSLAFSASRQASAHDVVKTS
jgi:hypothetical protein